MSSIFIVRHGNTFSTTETPRRIGARSDPELTAAGVAQAEALAEFFRRADILFDRVLTGPLRRTRHTAQIILSDQRSAVELEEAPWLREIDYGIDEGADEAHVTARLGDAALRAWDREAKPPAGWKVDPDGRRSDWDRFFADVRDRNVLLVTSSGIARFALLAALPRGPWPSLRLRTGALGMIERSDRGRLALRRWDWRPGETANEPLVVDR